MTTKLKRLQASFFDHAFNGRPSDEFFRSKKLSWRQKMALLEASIEHLRERAAVCL